MAQYPHRPQKMQVSEAKHAVFTFSHSRILAKDGNIWHYYDTFTATVEDKLVLTLAPRAQRSFEVTLTYIAPIQLHPR